MCVYERIAGLWNRIFDLTLIIVRLTCSFSVRVSGNQWHESKVACMSWWHHLVPESAQRQWVGGSKVGIFGSHDCLTAKPNCPDHDQSFCLFLQCQINDQNQTKRSYLGGKNILCSLTITDLILIQITTWVQLCTLHTTMRWVSPHPEKNLQLFL